MSLSRESDVIAPSGGGALTDVEVQRLREDFPILRAEVNGLSLIHI